MRPGWVIEPIMAGFSTDKDRKVIPRWRTFEATLRLKELGPVTPPRAHEKVTTDFLAQKKWDWRKHQTVGHAADLVGTALTLGREREVPEAARFLLQENFNASPWARELAVRVLRPPDNIDRVELSPEALDKQILEARVRTFRNLLRTEPRDPVTWVELSHTYAILGQRAQAERSMNVASQLAKNNRFVLRSASRLWVHFDDSEKAHAIISKADRTPHDPWLLAAEIAIGSINDKTPTFIRHARGMLSKGQFPPSQTSELASAIATLELASGSIKKSKKLFGQSLEDPTENSIAQAAWASRQNSAICLDDKYLGRPNTFEARSWSFYIQSRWGEVVKECKLWQADQPFSSRPYEHGSYVSAVALEDYETSQRFAKQGLMANPLNFTLLNNLAFSSINRADIDKAKETLSRMKRLQLSEHNRIVLQATQGLLAFRTGDIAVGRQFYAEACLKAKKMRDDKLLALGSTFYAIEEISQRGDHSKSALSKALKALQRTASDPIFRMLEHRLRKTSENAEDRK